MYENISTLTNITLTRANEYFNKYNTNVRITHTRDIGSKRSGVEAGLMAVGELEVGGVN